MNEELAPNPRPDEAAEIIEDLQAKLLRAEDERDIFKDALAQIVNQDYNGRTPPQSTVWAEMAFKLVKNRYGH